jgi:hypothetical protein
MQPIAIPVETVELDGGHEGRLVLGNASRLAAAHTAAHAVIGQEA